MRIVGDIRSAVALLTVVPVARADDTRPTAQTVAWFPWVGAGLGALAWSGVAGLEAASIAWGDGAVLVQGSLLVGVLVVAVWAGLTRFLHWDGWADVCDAWWGGDSPERRLEIMADPRSGAFAVIGIAIAVAAQLAGSGTVFRVLGDPAFLLVVPVVGRMGAVFAAWLGAPARETGLGAAVTGRPRVWSVVICASAVVVTGWIVWPSLEAPGIIWMLVSLFAAAAAPHLIASRMGGVTGDVMGASVVSAETFAIVSWALYLAI